MFSKEVLDESKALEEQWRKQCLKRYEAEEFKTTTASGIPIKPVYTPTDIEPISYEDIGLPGIFPYTRGVYPLQSQISPLINEVVFGYGLPEHTRERFELLKKEGMSGYSEEGVEYHILCDQPTYIGYDPDHPVSKGRVGQGGTTISTVNDLEFLLEGIALDKNFILFNIMEGSIPILAMYIVYAQKRGFQIEKLHGMTLNILYGLWYSDRIGFLPRSAFKLMTELIKFCSKNMPYWNHTSVEGYTLGECRATAPQEVAFTLASVIAINQECIKAGLNPDDFVPRYSPHLWAGNDFFETIAKLRAFRRVWAKIHRERFGCKNPKSLQTRFFVQTAGSALTAQQPLNNTIRAAFHTLAAVLGGANTLHTDAYDEVYCVPTEEAATLALRTQQIIQHETNATKVGDPLAGSYYVEWLTSKIEEEAYKLIAQVDRIGYIKAWESGWFRGELTQRAFEWRKQVENGEETIVGVNKYVTGEELKIPVFKIEPSTEETAIERVKKFRDERDNTKVKEALNSLRQTAKKVNEEWPEGGDLMPSVIEAARANATLGEMTDVLREVFGWGYAF